MIQLENPVFDVVTFLATAGPGRRFVQLAPKQTIFLQGDPADSVFYLQRGRAKITVVSSAGKEATIMLLSPGEFLGEGALAEVPELRPSTATAISACTALKIKREEIVRIMREEHAFSEMFMKFLLTRCLRTQSDLVDQLFNSCEKRLARILLLMAEFGDPGESKSALPKISQETLAEMIGATRSRVSFFMNRFRKQGLIDYNGRIYVNNSLLNVVMKDQLPDDDGPARLPIPAFVRGRRATDHREQFALPEVN